MARCCLACDTEEEGEAGTCPFCHGPTLRGRLGDYCPHGKRRPFRGWPCPRCREVRLRELGLTAPATGV